MKKLHLLVLFLFPITLSGQTYSAQQVDSLKRELLSHVKEDTIRVNLMIMVGYSDLSKNPDESMKITRLAWELSKKISWPTGIMRSLRQIGTILTNTAREREAIEYFQLAIHEAEKANDKAFLNTIYNNIGMIYLNTGENDKALEAFNNMRSRIDPVKSPMLFAFANTNAGTTYFRLGKLDSALSCFNRSTAVALQQQLTQILCYNYANTGAVYDKMKRYEEAIQEFRKAKTLADSTGDISSLCLSQVGLAEANFFLGRNQVAEQYCKEALKTGQQIRSAQFQQEAWMILSDIYKKTGNYKESLEAYKNHILFRDSLMNEEKKSEIVRQELEFDYERKVAKAKAEAEKKEALAQAEIDKQKLRSNAFMGIGAVVLLSGVTGFIGYKRRRDLEKKSIETQNELQTNKTELRVLRLQMDPHFIFNSLNAVSDYMLKNDIETADRYLTRFARLMRQTLEQSAFSEVTLEDDLQALKTYLDLEQLRLKGKMSYTLTIDENIRSEQVMVPSLILQPFIENSIVHGIGPKGEAGKISIHISREGNLLKCCLEDDGVGRQTAMADKNERKSLGMKITQTRIDLLNKMYNSNGGILLTDLQPGLRVEVRLPYNEQTA